MNAELGKNAQKSIRKISFQTNEFFKKLWKM